MTSDIAHRLAHYFGMSERYWLDLQRGMTGREKQNCRKRLAETIVKVRRINKGESL